MADLLGILEIDRIDLEQREIAFALLGASDNALDRVAGAQTKFADLRGRNINVVRPGEIIGVGRTQEAEAVLQHLDDAFADDLDVATGELFQNCEQQLLLAQERGVLHLVLFGESQEFGGGLGFQVRKFDFPHGDKPRIDRRSDRAERRAAGRREILPEAPIKARRLKRRSLERQSAVWRGRQSIKHIWLGKQDHAINNMETLGPLDPGEESRASCREHTRLFQPRNAVKSRPWPIDELDVWRS